MAGVLVVVVVVFVEVMVVVVAAAAVYSSSSATVNEGGNTANSGSKGRKVNTAGTYDHEHRKAKWPSRDGWGDRVTRGGDRGMKHDTPIA